MKGQQEQTTGLVTLYDQLYDEDYRNILIMDDKEDGRVVNPDQLAREIIRAVRQSELPNETSILKFLDARLVEAVDRLEVRGRDELLRGKNPDQRLKDMRRRPPGVILYAGTETDPFRPFFEALDSPVLADEAVSTDADADRPVKASGLDAALAPDAGGTGAAEAGAAEASPQITEAQRLKVHGIAKGVLDEMIGNKRRIRRINAIRSKPFAELGDVYILDREDDSRLDPLGLSSIFAVQKFGKEKLSRGLSRGELVYGLKSYLKTISRPQRGSPNSNYSEAELTELGTLFSSKNNIGSGMLSSTEQNNKALRTLFQKADEAVNKQAFNSPYITLARFAATRINEVWSQNPMSDIDYQQRHFTESLSASEQRRIRHDCFVFKLAYQSIRQNVRRISLYLIEQGAPAGGTKGSTVVRAPPPGHSGSKGSGFTRRRKEQKRPAIGEAKELELTLVSLKKETKEDSNPASSPRPSRK